MQYYIHYGLLHKFTRGKSVKDCYYLDAEEEGEEMQIADEKNDIDQLVHNQLLSEAMKNLQMHKEILSKQFSLKIKLCNPIVKNME